MVWGRELVHFRLGTAGGPSFKPLPVLMAAAVSPAGDAAHGIWLVLVRATALFSIVLAFRLARRVAGPIAGVLAAAALASLLVSGLQWATLQGYFGGPSIALILGAVDRHVEHHRGQAFLLGSLAGLLRPEVWPFLALYGFVQWRRGRFPHVLLLGSVLVLLPAVWLAPDWLGSGQIFNGADISRGGLFNGADIASPELRGAASSHHPALEVLGRTAALFTLPVLVAAAAAVLFAVRRAHRLVVSLGAGLIAWLSVTAVMAEAGFTVNDLYLAPAGGVVAVLAGVGVVWTIDAARSRGARLALAAAVEVVAVAYMFSLAGSLPGQLRDARVYPSQLDQLGVALARAGGPRRVLAPGRPAINPMFQTALAWHLNVALAEVQPAWGSSARRPGWKPPAVVFRTSASDRRDAEPSLSQRGLRLRPLARTGDWSVLLAEPRPDGGV
jgi:hypothetical protein